MQRIYFTFLLVVYIGVNIYAQDPVFSQFYHTPLQVNPAFAGITKAPSVGLNYRMQWSGFSNGYLTSAAHYSQLIGEKAGIGVQLIMDQEAGGILQSNYFSAFYSYNLTINQKVSIKLGFEAGIAQRSLDWDKLVFYDQIDERQGYLPDLVTKEQLPDAFAFTKPDISAGLLFYSKKFYTGISIKHLNQREDSFFGRGEDLGNGWPTRYAIHAGYNFLLFQNNNSFRSSFISPNIFFASQSGNVQLNFGALTKIGSIFAGTWYRHDISNHDAVIFLLGFKKEWFKLGYSYDFTVSKLTNQQSLGSHEISILFNFESGNNQKIDYNDCFNLFR